MAVTIGGKAVDAKGNASHNRLLIGFKDLTLKAGDELVISFEA